MPFVPFVPSQHPDGATPGTCPNVPVSVRLARVRCAGPRFTLNPIRVFAGSFGGPTLFLNSQYMAPHEARRYATMDAARSHREHTLSRLALKSKHETIKFAKDEVEEVFHEDSSEEKETAEA